MKILFYQWHSFMNRGIEEALHQMDIEYDVFFYQQKDWEKDDGIVEGVEKRLAGGNYTMVFSVNFAPLVAQVCEEHHILYVSWVYDAPIHIRNLEPLKYNCNRIFFFDRMQTEEFTRQGVHAFHMPLAADLAFAHDVKQRAPAKSADVSLVGKLYQTDYDAYLSVLSEWQRGYLDGILNAQMKLYGAYFLGDLIDSKLIDECNAEFAKASNGKFRITKRELEYMMACEITGRERYLALALLSKHFDVELYSEDTDKRLEKVCHMGYTDYYTGMPQVFWNSKVNLNISLKIISSGVPLRVFDIMGTGGFVLSNFQPEICELFTPGEDLIIYESIEDLYEKAVFYVSHTAERERIAFHGHETAAKFHTFRQRMAEILRVSLE